MCLENDFDEASTETLNTYLKTRRKEDLQNQILRSCSRQVSETPDEFLTKEFGVRDGCLREDEEVAEEEKDLFDEQPQIFKLKPSDFSDELAYTRAVIKQVRRTHSIDDRLENARKESISKNYTTRNIWPTALQANLVKPGSDPKNLSLRDTYYVKAIVPICKNTYTQCYNPKDLVAEKV